MLAVRIPGWNRWPGLTVPVTGVELRRTLRAVWPAGRALTGPAAELVAIASGRR